MRWRSMLLVAFQPGACGLFGPQDAGRARDGYTRRKQVRRSGDVVTNAAGALMEQHGQNVRAKGERDFVPAEVIHSDALSLGAAAE